MSANKIKNKWLISSFGTIALFCILLFSPHQVKASFSTSSITSYYNFNEVSGNFYGQGTADNVCYLGCYFTNIRGGTYHNAIGKFGGDVIFNSSSNYLSTQGGGLATPTSTNYAISEWVKYTGSSDTYNIDYSGDNFLLQLVGNTIYFQPNGTKYIIANPASGNINDGAWHNIIINGNQTTQPIMYIDGKTASTTPEGTGTWATYNSGAGSPYFGARRSDATKNFVNNAEADDLAYFSVNLSAEDIANLQLMDVWDASTYVPPVVNSGVIYAFGYPDMWSNPTVFQRNQTKYFNIFWNVCNDYNSLNSVRLQASLNGVGNDAGIYLVIPKDTIGGPQKCKGSIPTFHDNYTNFDTTATGTAVFTMTEYDASNTPIKVLTSNTITYISATGTAYLVSSMPNPLMIDLGNLPQGSIATATNTRLMFFYDFNGLNVASSSVCLWDYSLATSTGYCNLNALVASTTFGEIDIPTPTINTYKSYRFYTLSPNFTTLQSGLFSVNWSFTSVAVNPTCNMPSRDLSHVCDFLGPPDIVGTSTFDYSNWYDHFLCAGARASVLTVDFFLRPNCDAFNYFQTSFNNFQETPPFNIFYQFTDTIESALSSTTVESTTTFSVPWVHTIGATNTIYMLPVISSSSIPNAIGATNNSWIRLTVGWIMWVLGALVVVLMIWKL